VWEAIQKLIPFVGHLTTGPKLWLSVAIVCVAGFSLAVIWVPQSAPQGATTPPNPTKPDTGGALWPNEKSIDALKRKLDRISKDNAQIVKTVANSGQYGIYVGDLATQTMKQRDEVVYRLKELQRDGLIEVLDLTDLNARLNEDVLKVLAPNAADFINAYLK
jgi:hypothetical protein